MPGAGTLRIGLLSPPWFAVPPTRYGGTEAVVALLANGLVERGHDVTLFASGDSRTRARLVAAHPRAPSRLIGQTMPELEHVLTCLKRADAFDVISDHSGPLAVALSGLVETPFVHTVHNSLDDRLALAYDSALAAASGARLVSLSLQQRRPRSGFPWIGNVPNAVDLDMYPCRAHARGRHLLWVGRMSREKGPDRAVEVARQAGLPIVLAGKMHTRAEHEYFAQRVEPLLGASAHYIGEADRPTLVTLLHGAIALVNPIDWPEPFGLVMIEAMACGVPVLATRRGAVPEIVDHGVTGFIVDDHRSMAALIPAVRSIAPATCRRVAELRFSPARLLDDYLSVLSAAIAEREALVAVSECLRAAVDDRAATPRAPVVSLEA